MAEVTRDEVVTWARRRYGYEAGARVVEGPAAFWVPTAEQGVLVRRRTGDFWHTTGEPAAAIAAKSDRRLRRALGARHVAGSIRAGVTPERLREWLRERGYQHIEDRVTDVGWAFAVRTQDGRGLVVVKHTGEVWPLDLSLPHVWGWVSGDEAGFRAWMAAELPYIRPNEWVAH
jgi:hypothetical protein